MDDPPTTLHGLPVAVTAAFVDRTGVVHHLVAAGPHLRCLDHGDAGARGCQGLPPAWQRVLLADDHTAGPALRGVPHELTGYLAAEIRRHRERLDQALGPDLPIGERRRWHEQGWRAAPSLAGAYLAAGVDPGTAFVARCRGIEPADVPAALADPHRPVGTRITDDLPYEPL